MATVLNPPEQRVLLANISWDTYERLLSAHRDVSAPRFTYNQGQLEIMSPSAEHERSKELIALLVNIVAEEMAIDVEGFGSTTFRREDLERGFEPDACFYIKNVSRVRGKANLDLSVDPPPDLIIEIDITHPSINKFSIFARLGVPEVWQYDANQLNIFLLSGESYLKQEESVALPILTSAIISNFIKESQTIERPVWLRQLRAWARQQR
jgi:Uma2 family endonuclease